MIAWLMNFPVGPSKSDTHIVGVICRKCFKVRNLGRFSNICVLWSQILMNQCSCHCKRQKNATIHLGVKLAYGHSLHSDWGRHVCPQSYWAHVGCESMARFTLEHIEQRAGLCTFKWDMSCTFDWGHRERERGRGWLGLNTYFWHVDQHPFINSRSKKKKKSPAITLSLSACSYLSVEWRDQLCIT